MPGPEFNVVDIKNHKAQHTTYCVRRENPKDAKIEASVSHLSRKLGNLGLGQLDHELMENDANHLEIIENHREPMEIDEKLMKINEN